MEDADVVLAGAEWPSQVHASREALLGLIGRNLCHSLSPPLHNCGLSFAQLNGCYKLLDANLLDANLGTDATRTHSDDVALETLVDAAVLTRYDGFNVTMPFKTRISRHLHRMTIDAQAIGAVNVVRVIRSACRSDRSVRLEGHNTDCEGFGRAFTEQIHNQDAVAQSIQRVALIGAGGAGHAVAHALLKLGCRHISRIMLVLESIICSTHCKVLWTKRRQGQPRPFDLATPHSFFVPFDDPPCIYLLTPCICRIVDLIDEQSSGHHRE